MPFPKGQPCMEKTKRKLRESCKGNTNALGCHRTEEYKQEKRERMMGNTHALGSHQPEEVKEKKREDMMGNTFRLGHYPTEKEREKQRETMKGRFVGKNNPNYIHGKSNEPYPLEFSDTLKELIRYRDGYRCQKCGKHQSELSTQLHVHHIDHDPKNNSPFNLITLCNSCNGKANSRSNRTKWQKYFEKRVIELMRQKEQTRANLSI